MRTFTRHFILARETKGALFYTEMDVNGTATKGTSEELFTSLYVRKTAIRDNGWPQTMKVTVEMADTPAHFVTASVA